MLNTTRQIGCGESEMMNDESCPQKSAQASSTFSKTGNMDSLKAAGFSGKQYHRQYGLLYEMPNFRHDI